jgi:hypothetical protein
MSPRNKSVVSLAMDVLIFVVFLVILSVVFTGGFSVHLFEKELSATSVFKPAGIFLALFFLKLFVADFKKELEKNKILVVGVLLFLMIFCEVVSRVYYSFFVPQDLFWATENLVMKRKPDFNQLHGIDTIRVSKNKKITYEFIPKLRGHMSGWPKDKFLNINSLGFRDDEEKKYLKEKNKIRIVGLGGSVMLGQGVDFKDTYGEVVENELNLISQEKGSNKGLEFINLSVYGYNTTMKVETFFQKGLRFDPDLVIISYGGTGDYNLPNFIIKKENPWVSKKSFAVFYIHKRLEVFSNTKYGKFLRGSSWENQKKDVGIWGLDMAMWRNAKYDFIPDDYKFMVGTENYVREIKRLKQKCIELNIPLVMMFTVPEEKVLDRRDNVAMQIASELNIPVVKDHKETREFLMARGKDLGFLCVSDKDCHPNKWGHLIRGKKIASFVNKNYPFLSN